MRADLPVTGIEHYVGDGQSVVSKTEAKGRLPHVNPSFIEVSGFTGKGLPGKAHDAVRHPDMPPHACADLWTMRQA